MYYTNCADLSTACGRIRNAAKEVVYRQNLAVRRFFFGINLFVDYE